MKRNRYSEALLTSANTLTPNTCSVRQPALSHLSLNYPLSLIRSKRDCHAASLLVVGEFSWRNRGGGPPMEYASL